MRILAAFTASFAAGIFLAQYLIPAQWLLPCAVLAFLLACGRLFLAGDTGRRLLLTGTGLALAFGWNRFYVRQIAAPMEILSDTERAAVMTLCDYPVPSSYGARVTVQINGLPAKAVYYGDSSLLELVPGQILRDTVRFQDAARIQEDSVTSFTSGGVFLLAYGRGRVSVETGDADSPRFRAVRLGHAAQQKLYTILDRDSAAFLAAILTGDRSGLSVQAEADISESGLSHVLAVSGMHCGFLLALVVLLAGKHRRRLTAFCAIPLLVFYALLTGGKPSVVRACVMFSFLLIAPLFHRRSDGPTSLCAALFLILLQNPFAAASVSLQLSFASVAGMLWLTPGLYQLLAGEGKRIRRFFAASLAATVGALLFTVPLSAWYFGSFSLIAPVSNLLCLWAAAGAFASGLAALAIAFLVPPLGPLAAILPGLLSQYLLLAVRFLAKIPYHAVYFDNPYLKYWLAYVYLLFAAARWYGKPAAKKYVLSAALSVLTLALCLHLGEWLYNADMDAVILDVGQGQSVILSSENRYALVDCGSGNSWYHAGTTAGFRLGSMGCRRLDALILTHYDADHINGAESLMARLDVAALYVPEETDNPGARTSVLDAAQKYGIPVRFVRERETISFGNGTLTLFPPLGTSGDNERGISVLATVGTADLLITGDMGQSTEKRLMASYSLPDLEAVVVGHHGSRYSTSDALLSALTPETACISVGRNRYGHPSPETLQRLEEHGCAVYRTDLHGSIHLAMKGGEP